MDFISKIWQNPVGRATGWAKIIGLIIGLLGLIATRYWLPDPPWYLQLGIVLWYITLAALVVILHFYCHRLLAWALPWWFLGPWIAAWMNSVLVLFAYEPLNMLAMPVIGSIDILFMLGLAVLDGVVFGLIIGFLASRRQAD